MTPIEALPAAEVKRLIEELSQEKELSPAVQNYLQTLKDVHQFGTQTGLEMARDRAIAKRSNLRIVRTPEQVAQHKETSRMANLALAPEVQKLVAERDLALHQNHLSNRTGQAEVDYLYSQVEGLQAANKALEEENARLRKFRLLDLRQGRKLALVSDSSGEVTPVKRPGFWAMLRDMWNT